MNAKPPGEIGLLRIHAHLSLDNWHWLSKHLACRVPVATETNVVGDMSWSWPRYHHEIIKTNIYQFRQRWQRWSAESRDFDSCQHRPAAYLHG